MQDTIAERETGYVDRVQMDCDVQKELVRET